MDLVMVISLRYKIILRVIVQTASSQAAIAIQSLDLSLVAAYIGPTIHQLGKGDVQVKFSDIHRIWRDSVRLFFAPLVGAIHGAVRESRAVHKDVFKHRH